MNNTCKTAIAAAVAGGYVLGRTRKAKAAFVIGTFLAGRRFGLTPTALAAEGLRRLQESPQLAELREQIGGELLDAARAAASTSADRRFTAFADTLRERGWAADTLRKPGRRADEGREPDEREPADEAGEGDGGNGDGDGDDERAQDREEKPAARRHGSGQGRERPAKKAATRKDASAKKQASAGTSRPARKTAGKKAARKKAAPSRSRATTSRHGR